MRKIVLLFSMILFASFHLSAQNQRVSGTVTGPDGQSLGGATVLVAGTSNGVITDTDGRYSINAPSNGTLEFTYFGMVSQQVPVSGRTTIDVTMATDTQAIEEVVVVAYGTVKKSSLTGSVATVNATELKKVSTTSFEKALQGLSPGVIVSSTSGQPGSSTTVRIRGVGSLNASSAPLYVIDGIAVETDNISRIASSTYGTTTNPLSAINTNDIESISILKDASAAALYGSRAANGVIVVTTKKGKAGAATVNFRAQGGVTVMPTNGYELMNGEQHYKHYFNAYLRANNGDVARANTSTQNLYGGRNPYNVAAPLDANGNLTSGAKLMIDTNWMDELFNTGVSQEYDLSVSGGNDRSQYYISMGYFDQEGLVIGSGFERYSARTNVSTKVTNWFSAGINSTISKSAQDTPPGAGGGASPLTNALFVPNPVSVYDLDASFNKQYDAEGNVMYNFKNPIFNDMNTIYLEKEDIYNTKTLRAMVAPYITITPIQNLNWTTTASYDHTNMDETRWYNRKHGNGAAVNGRLSRYAINNIISTLSSTVNYDFNIADDHSFNVMGGYEAMRKDFNRVHAMSTGFPPGGLIELGLGGTQEETSSITDKETMLSWFGRLRYDYMDKIYLEGSIRADGSSRFAPGHRWGTFWSASAGWRISQESFMQGAYHWLDDLKLRASYGTSGNNKLEISGRPQLYGWQGLYEGGYSYNSVSGVNHSSLANQTLGWEISKNFNVGVDFSVFNRLSGSIDYFVKASDGLLLDRPLAPSSGLLSIASNLGGMRNTGIEIELHSTNIQTANFAWRTDFNIAHSKNKITKFPQDEITKSPHIWTKGYSLYEFYMQEWAGVNPENGEPLWYADEKDAAGNATGNRITTSTYSKAGRYKLGSALPSVYGGMNNTFTYKNIDFSFMLGYSFGGKIYDRYEIYLLNDGNNTGYQMLTDAMDYWTTDNRNAKHPAFVPNNTSGSNQQSSRYLYNADFIKLRSINLSYTLPQRWAKAALMSSIRIFASAENLIVWNLDKNFKGYDVELGGISGYLDGAGTVPIPRSFQFGVNLTF